MTAALAVAKHYSTSPHEVLCVWHYPLFLDALESLQVEAEINQRIREAQDQ